jgi:cell division protein FtsB
VAQRTTTERREQARLERERRRRARQAFALLLGAAWLAFGLWAVVGQGGLLDVKRTEKERQRLRATVEELEQANADLARKVQDLETVEFETERLAREVLDYQGPDEVIYFLPRP